MPKKYDAIERKPIEKLFDVKPDEAIKSLKELLNTLQIVNGQIIIYIRVEGNIYIG
ncbi:MAG: hypothetical protein QW222_05990 [Candidatus Bathyarchaeia archaeon]